MKLSTIRTCIILILHCLLMNEFFPWRLKKLPKEINVGPEDDGNRYTFK